jgi:hypothetical protein
MISWKNDIKTHKPLGAFSYDIKREGRKMVTINALAVTEGTAAIS